MANKLREEITARLHDALQKGCLPWRQPWVNHPNAGLPCNVISQRRYHGVNTVLLGLVANDAGYESKWWGTFKQWRKLGGSVKHREMGM